MTDLSDMQLAQSIVAGGQTIQTATPPARLVLLADLGILAHESVRGQVVHRTAAPGVPLFETRATVTPGGDFLLILEARDGNGALAFIRDLDCRGHGLAALSLDRVGSGGAVRGEARFHRPVTKPS